MSPEEKRKERNKELIEAMKRGDGLASFNAMESFFPRRPPPPKDPKAIARIFGPKEKRP